MAVSPATRAFSAINHMTNEHERLIYRKHHHQQPAQSSGPAPSRRCLENNILSVSYMEILRAIWHRAA
jgi:hypothetical protein